LLVIHVIPGKVEIAEEISKINFSQRRKVLAIRKEKTAIASFKIVFIYLYFWLR